MPSLVSKKKVSKWKPHTIYLGLDPGASGGIVFMDGKELDLFPLSKMTPRDIWKELNGLSIECDTHAALEEIHPAIFSIGKSSMSKLYGSYKQLEGFLIAAAIPYETVKPHDWQKALGIPKRKKGESQSKWKNRLKSKAQSLFPSENVTLAVADALLLAEYCKRKQQGRL